MHAAVFAAVGGRGIVRGLTLAPQESNPTVAVAGLTLNTDGTYSYTTFVGGTVVVGNYFRPGVAGVGAILWARLTGTGTSPGTLNTWQQLSSARSWNLAQGPGAGSKSFAGTMEYATDSGGANIIGSSVVNMAAIAT